MIVMAHTHSPAGFRFGQLTRSSQFGDDDGDWWFVLALAGVVGAALVVAMLARWL